MFLSPPLFFIHKPSPQFGEERRWMLSQKKRVEKAQEMLNLAEGSPEGISQDVIDLLKDNLDIEKRGVDQVPATDLARFIAKCRNVLPDQ